MCGSQERFGRNSPGHPPITYGVDGEGRPNTVAAFSGQNPVSSASYNSASQTTGISLGSGDSDAFSYDPNTGRMSQFKFTVGSTPQSVVGNLNWNANGSLSSLAITDPLNAANQQTCNYTHDDLVRIASGNCGSAASQTFLFDPFGNITKSGSPYSFQASYSPATNRITCIAGSGSNCAGGTIPTYDADGNVTSDSLDQYTWDAEGRPLSITPNGGSTATLTFDALGRTVEFSSGSGHTQVVYGPTGGKLALMNGQSLTQAFVPVPGGGTAVYNSGGLLYYRHADWLGSSRFASTPSQTMYSSSAYAPYGEPYAQAGTTDLSFTGQPSDVAGGSYDFLAREYSIEGRWPSPDPAGLAAVNPADPQTWNRYAYARNSPLMFTDPNGTCVVRNDPRQGDGHFVLASFRPREANEGREVATEDEPDCISVWWLWFAILGGGGVASGGGGHHGGYHGAPNNNQNLPGVTGGTIGIGTGPWDWCDPQISVFCTPNAWCDPGIDLDCIPNNNATPGMWFINEANGDTTCPLKAPLGDYDLKPDVLPLFQPELADALSNAIGELNREGVVPLLSSGFRTAFEQLNLQSAGGGFPVAKLSFHQVGLAVDFSQWQPQSAIRSALAGQGVTWGGNFTPPDTVHFQLPQAGARPRPAMVKACEGH